MVKDSGGPAMFAEKNEADLKPPRMACSASGFVLCQAAQAGQAQATLVTRAQVLLQRRRQRQTCAGTSAGVMGAAVKTATTTRAGGIRQVQRGEGWRIGTAHGRQCGTPKIANHYQQYSINQSTTSTHRHKIRFAR